MSIAIHRGIKICNWIKCTSSFGCFGKMLGANNLPITEGLLGVRINFTFSSVLRKWSIWFHVTCREAPVKRINAWVDKANYNILSSLVMASTSWPYTRKSQKLRSVSSKPSDLPIYVHRFDTRSASQGFCLLMCCNCVSLELKVRHLQSMHKWLVDTKNDTQGQSGPPVQEKCERQNHLSDADSCRVFHSSLDQITSQGAYHASFQGVGHKIWPIHCMPILIRGGSKHLVKWDMKGGRKKKSIVECNLFTRMTMDCLCSRIIKIFYTMKGHTSLHFRARIREHIVCKVRMVLVCINKGCIG